MNGITFDAGGLIALDRDNRQVIALLVRASELGIRVTVPATALAQAMRNPARQARLSRLIRQALTGEVAGKGFNFAERDIWLDGHTKSILRSSTLWRILFICHTRDGGVFGFCQTVERQIGNLDALYSWLLPRGF